jgi:hypothetical protein
VELKWVKKAAKDKAKELLNRDYERTRQILKEELTVIMEQFTDVKFNLVDREKDLTRAYELIR